MTRSKRGEGGRGREGRVEANQEGIYQDQLTSQSGVWYLEPCVEEQSRLEEQGYQV